VPPDAVPPHRISDRNREGSSTSPGILRQLRPLLIGASIFPVVAGLYWGRAVLMPIALAALLTFLLSPVVGALERARLARFRFGRVVAVILVVLLAFSLLSAVGWVLTHQIIALGHELPQYRGNLKAKIADLRGVGKGGLLEKVQSTTEEVLSDLQKVQTPTPPTDKPVPVIVQSWPTELWQLPTLLEGLASAGLVIALVVFMLLERQELRNRLIRLTGHRRLAITTKALDEAAARISRYLLMQTIINASYGVVVAGGLFLIGVPYALLWGFLASALRFIPYLGPLLAAVAPIALSLAVFPGWRPLLLAIALFVVAELLTNMVMEPLLYGQSAGVSQVALLVALAFWTWLWGPIGLLLATPLTVCVVVLGKHVAGLEFITILMTDEDVLEPPVSYYQRLLAKDALEADDIVADFLEAHPAAEVYDAILLPALSYTKRDRDAERVSDDDVAFVHSATREVVEEIAGAPSNAEVDALTGPLGEDRPPPHVIACPARDEVDELALGMLAKLIDRRRCYLQICSAKMLLSEVASLIAGAQPAVLIIAGVAPDGLPQTRYLCKRLRARFPTLRILVGRWGDGETEGARERLLAAGADAVGTTLLASRDQLLECLPLVAPEIAPSAMAT
jgi:predicted PurR-regulated permease PerM